VAVNVSMSFFEAVTKGVLVAEAREVAINEELATCLVDVRDEAGGLVAQMQGTVYRKREGIGDVIS
jgi:acyl-CoA thioesterase